MGRIRHDNRPWARRARPACLAALFVLSATAGLAFVQPAAAESYSRSEPYAGGYYSMSWGGRSYELFAAPSTSPGQRTPSIDGDLVACRVGSAAAAAGFDIRYRALGAPPGVWGGSGHQVQPAVSQGLIAGLDRGRVAVFDPATGVAVPVSDDAAVPSAPAFSGDLVVWQDRRGGDWDIYGRRFDREAGVPAGEAFAICTAAGDQVHPAADGDFVVWQDRRGGDWDVVASDVATMAESVVAGGPGDQRRPDVHGDVVVWQDSRRGNWDVFAHHRKTGETWPVTTARGAQVNPAVSDKLVVWQDSRPRYVQTDDRPTVRYTAPKVFGYSLPLREELDEIGSGPDGAWQRRPAVSGEFTVFESQWGPKVAGVSRVKCWRTHNLWAYSIDVIPDDYWTNAEELTFTVDVVACPDPPVSEMSVYVGPVSWFPPYAWEPFAAQKTVPLTMPDGRKEWDVALRDSAGHSGGSGGSYFILDTRGPACRAPSAVTVRRGQKTELPFRVTDALSPKARVGLTIRRGDGSAVTELKPRWARTGTTLARAYVADLLPGTYTFEVTATDLAGNSQVRIGSNTLTVR